MTPRRSYDALARPITDHYPTTSHQRAYSTTPVARLVPADSVAASPQDGAAAGPLPSILRFGASPHRSPAVRTLSALAKRLCDVVIAAVLLVVFMPILLAAATAVRMTSRGPVFYMQERYGLDMRPFKIIKFRSMVVDADQRLGEMSELADVLALRVTDAPAFKSAEDPRVTRIGRLLRRANIDELPQLLNVLRGDMSLVGPRPLVPAEVDALGPVVAARRHSVRPGLTCLWQVLRNEETTFVERMQLDLLYVNRRSIALDIALMALTPSAILGGNGSY